MRTLTMLDTGASFSMANKGFCLYHNLTITAAHATFHQADCISQGNIIGYVDFDLQVHDNLIISLRRVKVNDSPSYRMILGQDVMEPQGNVLGPASIHLTKHIVWTSLADGGTMYTSPLVPPDYHRDPMTGVPLSERWRRARMGVFATEEAD